MIWLLVIAAIVIAVYLYFYFNLKFVVKQFEAGNTITFGKKGKGKDVLFALIIHARKKRHYANIPYDKNSILLAPKQYSISPNTYRNFINGKVERVKKDLIEGADYYLSDGGIVLPSQFDSLLDKDFPSFPLAYALSRQLWGSNVHVNSQALGRVWIKLREQADSYFECRSRFILPGFIFLNVRFYDKYNSALQCLAPLKKMVLNKYARANSALYTAQNGEIKEIRLLCPKKWLKYDTRYFHQVLFGEKYKKIKTKKVKSTHFCLFSLLKRVSKKKIKLP